MAENRSNGLLDVPLDGINHSHNGWEPRFDLSQNLEKRDCRPHRVACISQLELDFKEEEDLFLIEDGKQLLGEDEFEFNELRAFENVEKGIHVLLGVFEAFLPDLLDPHSLV